MRPFKQTGRVRRSPPYSQATTRKRKVGLTLGGALDLVVEGLYALLDELVTSLAELEDVGAVGSLLDELLDDGRDDSRGGLVLVKGGGGD